MAALLLFVRRMTSTRFVFAGTVSLVAAVLAACAAETAPSDEEAVVDESDLTGSCDVGKNCPPALTLLEAGAYPRTTPARYANVLISPPGNQPRILKTATSGTLRLARNDATLVLRGPTPGAPITVTDILLVEVRSPTGGLLTRGFAGYTGGKRLTFFDTELRRLGGDDARTIPAGAIDLGPLLPKDGVPFKLKLSALVPSGPSSISDVVADVVVPPPPPPPPPGPIDPWDPRSCTGAPITQTEARQKFARGALHVDLGRVAIQAQKRACSDVTGCADWAPLPGLPYIWRWSDPRQGGLSAFNLLPLPASENPSMASFDVRPTPAPHGVPDPGLWMTRLHLSYLTGADGFDADLPFSGPKVGEWDWDGAYNQSWVGPCTELRCPGKDRSYGGSVQFKTEESLVTKSCLRIVASTSERWTSKTGQDEYRVLFTSRY